MHYSLIFRLPPYVSNRFIDNAYSPNDVIQALIHSIFQLVVDLFVFVESLKGFGAEKVSYLSVREL